MCRVSQSCPEGTIKSNQKDILKLLHQVLAQAPQPQPDPTLDEQKELDFSKLPSFPLDNYKELEEYDGLLESDGERRILVS